MNILLETIKGYDLVHLNGNGSIDNVKSYNFGSLRETLKSLKTTQKDQIGDGLKYFLKGSTDSNFPLVVPTLKIKRLLQKEFEGKEKKILVNRDLIKQIKENLEKKGYDQQKKKDNCELRMVARTFYGFKLVFSTKRIDYLVTQCLKLNDQIEKVLISYSCKLKEWYNFHFPELEEIIEENLMYALIVRKIQKKETMQLIDLSDLVDEETEKKIKDSAFLSLGKKLNQDEIDCIVHLANQIIEYYNLKENVNLFLKNRMYLIAPNLSALVGEKIGARLISHSGSLVNLCKSPASTVQMFGAEKALFRALKTKTFTPKFGHIFNAKLVSEVDKEIAGKISRILASKASLCSRIDALGESKLGGSLGLKYYLEIEKKAHQFHNYKKTLNRINQ